MLRDGAGSGGHQEGRMLCHAVPCCAVSGGYWGRERGVYGKGECESGRWIGWGWGRGRG